MDWLSEQYRRVEEQKLKQARTVQYLRILFRQWPHSEPESTNRQYNERGVDTGKSSNVPPEGAAVVLTKEEQEGMLLVDQLLSKAQRTRDVQRKLEEPKKSRVKEAPLHRTKQDSSVQKQVSSADLDQFQESERHSNKDIVKETCETSKNVPSSNKWISYNVKTKQCDKVKPMLKVGQSFTGAKTLEKTERSRISARPQSSSGHRKVVPAHANAPFQTNLRLTSSRLQTTYGAATAKTSAKSRGVSSGSAGSRGKSVMGSSRMDTAGMKGTSRVDTAGVKGTSRVDTAGVKGTLTVDASSSGDSSRSLKAEARKTNETNTAVHYIESEQQSQDRHFGNTDYASKHCRDRPNEKREHDVGTVQEKIQTVSLDDLPGTSSGACSAPPEDEASDKKIFNLVKDGGTLSIPGRLKKLLYQNRKLRQKLYTQNVTQKVNSPHSTAQFPQHLDHAFGDEGTQLIQLQAKQAQHILHTYTSLSQMLDSLHLHLISGETHPADIYRAKKLMEYILVTFQEMEQNLHTTDFSKLTSAVTHSGWTIPKLPLAEASSLSIWYNKNTFTGSTCAVPAYSYRSYKQLERYMTAVYQVQLLQFQSDVMDTVAKLLLPLLQSLDPGSSEYAHVLRAGYSLLSKNRNHMPVIVVDTIQDESGCETNDEQQP